jgi:uncharacterized membrane protein YadS
MKHWTEDTTSILLGFVILGMALVVFLAVPLRPVNNPVDVTDTGEVAAWTQANLEQNVAAGFLTDTIENSKPARWGLNPFNAFSFDFVFSAVVLFFFLTILFGGGALLMRRQPDQFLKGFVCIFAVGLLAYLLANQTEFRSMGLGYALWAIVLGLLISNVFGIPEFVRPALQPELYIKTGLVLLGAEVLFGKILAIGLPGIFVAWIVTPIVLITTFWFGQKILRISSKTLNITISADMSVCGVSAAIATAAACRATKEELTTAVGLSMIFTSIMMVAMPAFINAVGMPEVLGGAWIGGTIDATGAVVAAGAFLGDTALNVAATIKMIQNIMIGVIAFAVAVYWTTKVDNSQGRSVGAAEIWLRFPKFVLGFLGASILFSLLVEMLNPAIAIVQVENGVLALTSAIRGWLFCLAFASIGLSANFRELRSQFHGGKPLILYVCGQTLNLCLTLLMAWIMFYKVFPEITNSL